jgi:hypothetical protein
MIGDKKKKKARGPYRPLKVPVPHRSSFTGFFRLFQPRPVLSATLIVVVATKSGFLSPVGESVESDRLVEGIYTRSHNEKAHPYGVAILERFVGNEEGKSLL